jgi:DNA (cytosine-5)-methyltransferase 1
MIEKMERVERPTVVDIFCGAGGLSEGFKQAGFDPLLGIDSDPFAVMTYRKHHGNALQIQVQEVTAELIREATQGRRIDVLAAGPPCQAFSTVAVAKLRSLKKATTIRNPLNQLYREFLRLVKVLQPSFFVLENVGRMFSIGDGIVKKKIEIELQGHYTVTFYYENAADFGVPQIRKRGLVIGNNLGVSNPVLNPTHFDPGKVPEASGMKQFVTLREAISDLPKIRAGGGKEKLAYRTVKVTDYEAERRKGADAFVYNHIARKHSAEDLRIFKLLKQGDWISDLPSRYNRYRKDIFMDKYKKQSWDRPSSTVLAHLSKDGLMFIHPDRIQNRSLTPREAARLQSFDDCYIFEGPRTRQYIQIGNAVPPLFARAVAGAIRNKLEERLSLTATVG